MRIFRVTGPQVGRAFAKRRWLSSSSLILFTLALVVGLTAVLVWTSSAPALTLPTLGSQAKPAFAAGEYHSLAVMGDGSLWAWGWNGYGQRGDGGGTEQVSPIRIGTDTDWASVAASRYHSLALKSDGSLWAWGDNGYGTLGDGTTTIRYTPIRVGTDTDWVAISAGSTHSLGLKSDGSLWAWGGNAYGQLGDGGSANRLVPTRIGTGNDWVAVSAGGYHSLALKSDGSLWAWGYNDNGQLGDGGTTNRLVPTHIGTGTGWVATAGGGYHSLALKSDGSLWAWGDNASGTLGDGTTTDRRVPTHIGTGTSWVAVSAGEGHSLALKSDGSLWDWGLNSYGELGDGTTTDRHAPARVGTGTDWVAIDASDWHSLALRGDGVLWAWGYDGGGAFLPYYGIPTEWLSLAEILHGVKLSGSTTTTTTSTTATTTSSTTTTTLATKTFSDVSATNCYYAAISAMASRSIISGYGDGTFGPDKPVLRQHFAKMIVGAMGLTVTEDDWQDSNPPFADCGPDDPSSLYPHDYIAVAKAHGLTSGKTATAFAPEANITRAQMVTMVVRAAQNSGITLKAVGTDYAGTFRNYSDPTHGGNVHLADANGLLQGLQIEGAAFSWMAGNATRGQVAQVLWNLMKQMQKG